MASQSYPSLWPSLLAFAVVIGLIPLALAVVKRAQNLRPQRRGAMNLVDTLSVGPRERVAIVEVDGRRLVIGITAQSIALLADAGASALHTDAGTPASAATTVERPALGPFANRLAFFKNRAGGAQQ